VAGGVHGLQSAVKPPQPSPCSPQVVAGKLAQVSGWHAPPSGATQWLYTHACPAGHVAHVRRSPQPSSVYPHWTPSWPQLLGAQALPASTASQWLAMQLLPAAQTPQLEVMPPHPSAE